MPVRVVVTGAGGFVGGFVAGRLAARGFAVTAVTRRAPAGEAPGLDWRVGDLREPSSLPGAFDVLIHCAAEIPARCPDPAELYRGNLDVSRGVFERAMSAGARAVVFLSSMSAYGTITAPEVKEDTPPQDPDPYGAAKRDTEALLERAVSRDGLRSGLAIRLPGTVGRGSHHNFLSDALGRVLAGEPVRANNPESLFNNIVYVGDLAEFLVEWTRNPRPGYAVTNLAAREPLRIREVLASLFSLAGRAERVVFEPGGKKPFLISLERALSLGFRPRTVRDSLKCFVGDSLTS